MHSEDLKPSENSEANLTLIGVGPGDPSLLTLAAIQAIQDATVIAFPVSKDGESSLAANIASRWISKEKKKFSLVFPMLLDKEILAKAWRDAGEKLAIEVANGERVVFLCQGDASLFATSSYVLFDIKSNYPECPIRIIPGVNSFSAAAAIAHMPLTMQKEQLLIIPTPEDPDILEDLIDEAENKGRVLVLLKLGKRWLWVRDLLEKKNLLESTVFAQRIGFSDQKIKKSIDIPRTELPYFSLLIIRQCWSNISS
tara:strand:- start:4799 stop:5563 length:765 start_codon:yes stop_codon:yes gene_type:complete